MREIKFRIWNGESIEETTIDFNIDKDTKYKEFYIYPDDVFMQFTGLRDKNGVEIYEGDMLKIEMDWGYGLAEIIIKVYFENGSFRAKALNSHEDIFLLELPYLEVIGNIYENPELLRED